jgi:hypothetical protein
MLRRSLCWFLLLILPFAANAQDKAPISAVVRNATYICVMTYSGDMLNPEVTPEDRHAVANIEQAIEKWGRYKLVYNRGEADLMLVVRTGRTAEVHGGVQVGTSTDRPRGKTYSIGAEAGDPQDTLEAYLGSQGTNGPPLWRGRAKNGLKLPEVRLMQEFRSCVEAAEKSNRPKSKS